MVFYIVGVGPGDPEYITLKAKKIIEICSTTIAWKAVLEQFRWLLEKKEVIELSGNQYELIEQMIKKSAIENICLLVRGDPNVAEKNLMSNIKSYCEKYQVECVVISGVSSANLALSRSWIDLSNAIVISLHSSKNIEDDLQVLTDAARLKRFLVIFPKLGLDNIKVIAKELLKIFCCNPKVYVMQRLSFVNESIDVFNLSELLSLDRHIDNYTIIVIEPCSEVCY